MINILKNDNTEDVAIRTKIPHGDEIRYIEPGNNLINQMASK